MTPSDAQQFISTLPSAEQDQIKNAYSHFINPIPNGNDSGVPGVSQSSNLPTIISDLINTVKSHSNQLLSRPSGKLMKHIQTDVEVLKSTTTTDETNIELLQDQVFNVSSSTTNPSALSPLVIGLLPATMKTFYDVTASSNYIISLSDVPSNNTVYKITIFNRTYSNVATSFVNSGEQSSEFTFNSSSGSGNTAAIQTITIWNHNDSYYLWSDIKYI